MSTNRKLGTNQEMALRSLRDHGPYPGSWYLDNDSSTVRVLESLVRRGLVIKCELPGRGRPITYYRLP